MNDRSFVDFSVDLRLRGVFYLKNFPNASFLAQLFFGLYEERRVLGESAAFLGTDEIRRIRRD